MWINGLLILILGICTITDLRKRRIYNIIVFPGILLALISHLVTGGWLGGLHSLYGFSVGLGLLLIPFLLGGMGAGDVKLLALVGAMKGTLFVLHAAIYMSLIGAVMALGILLFRKGRIRTLWLFLFNRFVGVKTPLLLDKTKKLYPYGVAIAGGAIMGLILEGKLFVW